jgi:hypothetical protein
MRDKTLLIELKHGVTYVGFINDQENNGIKNRKHDGILGKVGFYINSELNSSLP